MTIILTVIVGLTVAVLGPVLLEGAARQVDRLVRLAGWLAGTPIGARLREDAAEHLDDRRAEQAPPAALLVDAIGFVWAGWRYRSLASRAAAAGRWCLSQPKRHPGASEVLLHASATAIAASVAITILFLAVPGGAPPVSIGVTSGMILFLAVTFVEWASLRTLDFAVWNRNPWGRIIVAGLIAGELQLEAFEWRTFVLFVGLWTIGQLWRSMLRVQRAKLLRRVGVPVPDREWWTFMDLLLTDQSAKK